MLCCLLSVRKPRASGEFVFHCDPLSTEMCCRFLFRPVPNYLALGLVVKYLLAYSRSCLCPLLSCLSMLLKFGKKMLAFHGIVQRTIGNFYASCVLLGSDFSSCAKGLLPTRLIPLCEDVSMKICVETLAANSVLPLF